MLRPCLHVDAAALRCKLGCFCSLSFSSSALAISIPSSNTAPMPSRSTNRAIHWLLNGRDDCQSVTSNIVESNGGCVQCKSGTHWVWWWTRMIALMLSRKVWDCLRSSQFQAQCQVGTRRNAAPFVAALRYSSTYREECRDEGPTGQHSTTVEMKCSLGWWG